MGLPRCSNCGALDELLAFRAGGLIADTSASLSSVGIPLDGLRACKYEPRSQDNGKSSGHEIEKALREGNRYRIARGTGQCRSHLASESKQFPSPDEGEK